MSASLPNRKPSANVGAGCSPRRTVQHASSPNSSRNTGAGRRFLQWVQRRFSEHFTSSMIALAFTLGGLLMLVYFYRIRYLPVIDLKSATGILLGVAITGMLALLSLAVLLGLPGAALQLCLRYRIINPGAGNLDKEEKNSARTTLKSHARVKFLAYVYVAEFLALLTIFGPAYLGLTHTVFGWPLVITTWAISGIFLGCVAALAMRYEKGGPVRRLVRVRYRKIKGYFHGLWVLGFLTLLLIFISTFLFQLFPLFQQESDFVSLLNYFIVISTSCAIGIIAIHNWKSALIFGMLPLFLFLFVFGGGSSISVAVMRVLKLGALENTVILTTPAGCQSITSLMTASLCKKYDTSAAVVACHIRGLTILSRIGEEQLLAFKEEQSETRLTLRSKEVISIAYLEKKSSARTTTQTPACIAIETIHTPFSSEN